MMVLVPGLYCWCQGCQKVCMGKCCTMKVGVPGLCCWCQGVRKSVYGKVLHNEVWCDAVSLFNELVHVLQVRKVGLWAHLLCELQSHLGCLM